MLSVVRCHKGVSAACFFKKHPVSEGEGTAILEIENSEGEKSDYFYLKDERGLISEAQLGTLEFHVWGSRADDLERPDMMIFDLDPDEGMGLDQIRQGVRSARFAVPAKFFKDERRKGISRRRAVSSDGGVGRVPRFFSAGGAVDGEKMARKVYEQRAQDQKKG